MNDQQVDGRPCRTVEAIRVRDGERLFVDQVNVSIPYPHGGKVLRQPLPCKVLRAWQLGPDKSGWALLCPKKAPVSKDWASFVGGLDEVLRK